MALAEIGPWQHLAFVPLNHGLTDNPTSRQDLADSPTWSDLRPCRKLTTFHAFTDEVDEGRRPFRLGGIVELVVVEHFDFDDMEFLQ
jgi:hypothetical protein